MALELQVGEVPPKDTLMRIILVVADKIYSPRPRPAFYIFVCISTSAGKTIRFGLSVCQHKSIGKSECEEKISDTTD